MDYNHQKKLWRALYIVFILILEYQDAAAVTSGNCHMLIGGSNSTSRFMPSVEIFNVEKNVSKVHSQKLAYGLKSHSGGILNVQPVICGGIVNDTHYSMKCFEYFDGSWTSDGIPDLTIHSSSAGKAIVDAMNKKMYIFGGANFDSVPQIKILNYNDTDKSWENGTLFYDDGVYYGHCSVLVNRTVYLFGLGGRLDGTMIATFDLDAPEKGIIKLDATLLSNRHKSTCAEVNGSIYIVGGLSIGVEMFSLKSKSSQKVSDFPNDYMLYAQLMQYNDDLYLYGGVLTYNTLKTVFKFSTSTWEWQNNITSLQEERSSFVALYVDDSFCLEIATTTTAATTDSTSSSTTAVTGTTDPSASTTTSTTTLSTTTSTMPITSGEQTTTTMAVTTDSTSSSTSAVTGTTDPSASTTTSTTTSTMPITSGEQTTTTMAVTTDSTSSSATAVTGTTDPSASTTTSTTTPSTTTSTMPITSGGPLRCDKEGIWSNCSNKYHDKNATDFKTCQSKCASNDTCGYLSFNAKKKICLQCVNCTYVGLKEGYISSEKECYNPTTQSPTTTTINDDCQFSGQWTACKLETIDKTATDYLRCHQHCQITSMCEYFSFLHSKKQCYHFLKCNDKKSSMLWMSGKKGCPPI